MQASIDPHEFVTVTSCALRTGEAAVLAEQVTRRWRPAQLCPLLEHADANVRRIAAVTLGLIGDAGVVPCLAKSLHDPDEQVNQMAEHGLWSIWFRACSPPAAKPFREGVTLLTQEAYEPAVRKFAEATRLDPQFAEAYNQCAIAHFFVYQWEESISDCRLTLRLMPQHFGAISGMGHCYVQLGNLSKALECYRRALRVNPRMPAIARAADQLEARLNGGNNASGEFLVDEIVG